MATLKYPKFYSLGGRVFYLNDHQTIFQGPFVQRHAKMKFPFFDQNHGLTPLRKNSMATV